MANFKKYPVYQYDEPAIYNDFRGGLNTDPSSENLLDNELRDVTNMDYINSTLSKRMGAKKLIELNINEDLSFCQGLWIFSTPSSTYVVIAVKGQLYYSLYDQVLGTNFIQLRINIPYDQIYSLQVRNSIINSFSKHEGYVLQEDEKTYSLIFQNKQRIEGATIRNSLFLATGTRIVEVYEEEYELKARVIEPYKPSGIESTKIGLNYLHPYPLKHINTANLNSSYTAIHGIIQNGNTLTAIMSYASGESAQDYKFQWKIYDEEESKWVLLTKFSEDSSIGVSSYTFDNLINNENKTYRIAVSFANSFSKEEDVTKNEEDGEEPVYVIKDGDWTPNKIDGSWYGGSEIITSSKEPSYNERWLAINSCKKVLSDGDKLLYYDDDYNSGEIFKTVIGNPYYITLKGGLNFKTTKNERVVKVIHFKGVLVVFSHSEYAGGNIAVITGNGDDFAAEGDSTYSPYIRRFVNTSIGCDNPYTVQVADNLLIFKDMDKIYFIEGSELNSEIIEVYTINDKIKHYNGYVKIPWDDNSCVSEITNEYYALIWKEKAHIENGQKVLDRPAMRLKMYYKNGYALDNRVYFPWLKDEGSVFNVDIIIQLGGISTHLYNNNLIQYIDETGLDLGEEFTYSVRLRAYDLNYPKVNKYIKSIIVYYYKDIYDAYIKLEAKNESGNVLLSQDSYEAPSSIDKPSIQLNDNLHNNYKIGRTLQEIRVFEPKYKFPCMLVDVYIEGKSKGLFSLSSVTFNYITSNLPAKSTIDTYKKIITKDSISHLESSKKLSFNNISHIKDSKDNSIIETPQQSFGNIVEKDIEPSFSDTHYPIGTIWIYTDQAANIKKVYLLVRNSPVATWLHLLDDSNGTYSTLIKSMSDLIIRLEQEVNTLKQKKIKEVTFTASELENKTISPNKPLYVYNVNNNNSIKILDVLRREFEEGSINYNKVLYDCKELSNKKIILLLQEPIDGKVIYTED